MIFRKPSVLRFPSLRAPLDILFLLCCVVLVADVLVPELWGSGRALREFMHVDDCADALVFLLKTYSDYEHVNVGTGDESLARGFAYVTESV